MEPPWKKSARSVDEWLLEPENRRPGNRETEDAPQEFAPDTSEAEEADEPRESIGAETAQWIVDDLRAPNGQASQKAPAPPSGGKVAEEKLPEFSPPPAPSPQEKLPEFSPPPAPTPPAEKPQGETAEANRVGGELGETIAKLESRVEEESRRADREAERADKEAAKAAKLADQAKAAESGKRKRSRKTPKAEQALEQQREENAELAARVRKLQTELRAQVKEAEAELAAAVKEGDAKAKKRIKQADTEANARIKEAEAEFDSRLRQMEEDLTKQSEAREGELRDRIKELEASLAEATKQARAKKTATTKAKRRTTASKGTTTSRTRKSSGRPKAAAGPRASRSTRAKRSGAKGAKVDLNAAKFEELRELGLSVTQSARLIAYRDVRGGYDSLDELDEIPGLSAETRGDLRARLKLS